jgi:hypothetical protein
MTAADGAALREYVAKREIVSPEGVGDMIVTRLYHEGATAVRIDRADPSICVSVELIDEADGELVSYDSGILTFRASNKTLRYRVLGSTGNTWRQLGEDEWHHAPVVCELIGVVI